jgi:peroxiredoxin
MMVEAEMSESAWSTLPEGLPVPEDDGACAHLPGSRVPSVPLPSTSGQLVDLGRQPGRVVCFCYPRTGRPGEPAPDGWDLIPGARGCTPEACGFRDLNREFIALGVRVFGLSAQSSEYQRETAERLHLTFELLSDQDLRFTRALRLPTFEAGGMTLIKRLTLLVEEGTIRRVFYPVFPPDAHPRQVLEALRS